MSWKHDETTGAFIRDDGLQVLQDGGQTWMARDANGWLLDGSRTPRRRSWGSWLRATTALDGERPNPANEPPHPANGSPSSWEDADRAGPVGQAAAEVFIDPREFHDPPDCDVALTVDAIHELERRLRAYPDSTILLPCGGRQHQVVREWLPGLRAPQVTISDLLAQCARQAAAQAEEAGATEDDSPATDGHTTGPAPDGPRAVTPAEAQPSAQPLTGAGAGGGARPVTDEQKKEWMRRAREEGERILPDVKRRLEGGGWMYAPDETAPNPGGPAEAAHTQPTPPVPPPSAIQGSTTAAVLNTPAAGTVGVMPDECQLLTEDDHRARRVTLPDGRTVQRMTSSLTPMALGLSPRGGGYAAWAIATGQMPGPDDSEVMRMGRRYEAPARDEYRFRHPEYRVHTIGTLTREHWAADSADGLVLLATGEPVATLEIKHRSRGEGWGMPGTDEVPTDVLVQALWHVWAHGVERCDVVLVVGLKLTEYMVRRHEPTLTAVVERAHEWWERHVVGNVEPPLDALPLTLAAVKAVYHEATEPALEPTPQILELARRRAVWAQRETEAAGYKDLCDVALRKAMAHHGGITGVLTRYAERGRVDWKRLLQEHPELQLDPYRGEPIDKTRFIYKLPAEPADAKAPAQRALGAQRP